MYRQTFNGRLLVWDTPGWSLNFYQNDVSVVTTDSALLTLLICSYKCCDRMITWKYVTEVANFYLFRQFSSFYNGSAKQEPLWNKHNVEMSHPLTWPNLIVQKCLWVLMRSFVVIVQYFENSTCSFDSLEWLLIVSIFGQKEWSGLEIECNNSALTRPARQSIAYVMLSSDAALIWRRGIVSIGDLRHVENIQNVHTCRLISTSVTFDKEKVTLLKHAAKYAKYPNNTYYYIDLAALLYAKIRDQL